MFIRLFYYILHPYIIHIDANQMGSGISISKQQVIYIIQRDLKHAFEEAEKNSVKVDDNGYLIHETFDTESNYRKTIRELERLLRENSVQ